LKQFVATFRRNEEMEGKGLLDAFTST